MSGPETELGEKIQATKHRLPNETFLGMATRVVHALNDSPEHREELQPIVVTQRFMFAGRIPAGVGTDKHVTPFNCYASAKLEDSFVEGKDSIMGVATQGAATMRMGGGIGFDFSPLRPRNALIKKLGSQSSGPVGFMPIYDSVCQATSSYGNRRGAMMGGLIVHHPDIREFIHSKRSDDKLTGFNISAAITDEFMNCMIDEKPFDLRFDGEVYETTDARELWEEIMQLCYDWAEPGVLFIDTINRMNNLWYCEDIAITNPCAEQPLPPNGACLLGSYNLTKYLRCEYYGDVEIDGTCRVTASRRRYSFNMDQLVADVPAVVRALDNVIDEARYPLPEQRAEAVSKRRMGIGVTGLANTLEAMGLPYGTEEFCAVQEDIHEKIAIAAYWASVELAKEKGAFPLFDADKYCEAPFIRKLPQDLQDAIRKYGIRNSHLLSIAPTGTISLTADNVSSGIEPVFADVTARRVKTVDGWEVVEAPDYGLTVLGVRGTPCADVTIEQHLRVAQTAAKWVDSAVSKTINCPQDVPWDEFVGIYRRAWEMGCKGITVYRTGCKREALLTDADTDIGESCTIDPATGKSDCS